MIKTGKAGSGTYGTVYNAKISKSDDSEIAVKRNIIDSDISFSGSIKEMDLLNRLRGHPYIVKLISVSFGNPFVCPNSPVLHRKGYPYKEDYLHFIFEKGEKNLHHIIYEKKIHVSYLKLSMVQILLAVEYMHAKGVIHRDIKPSNLLWFVDKNKTSVKLCDFGLSKIHTNREPSSPHLVTCWYRAPEICSQENDYSFPSDIWSVGCVFYEMIAKNALLVGAKDDDVKILSKIIGLIPTPNNNDIFRFRKKVTLTKAASPKIRKSWRELICLKDDEIEEFNRFPNQDANYENFLDLIDKMLKLNPKNRLTATEALDHPFFYPYQNIIEWSRTNYPPKRKTEPKIEVLDCIERRWATKLAFIVFNGRGSLTWYKHRMLFQSIDMFDRYLVYCSKKVEEKVPSKLNGKYLTKYEAELRYIVCLYMSIKYFTTLSTPISFYELVSDSYKTPKAIIEAEEFEKIMLRDVLRFKIYRETIYEASEVELDEYKIRDLVLLYGELDSRKGITPNELLEEFLKIE